MNAPKILAFGDLHLGAGRDHRVDALADQAGVLEQIATLVHEQNVDLVLNAGDTFDRPQPPVAAQHVWQRFVRALDVLGVPMVTVLGNAGHDQVNSATATAAELHEGPLHRVSRRPEIIDEFAGVDVVTLPSVPVHRLVAEHPELVRGDVNELAASLLVQTATELHRNTTPNKPKILLAHWSIAGARLPNGLPVADLGEPVLHGLREIGFDAVVAGHIHNSGVFDYMGGLDDGRPMLYVGSPMCLNFGEVDTCHDCWVLEPGVGARRIPLDDRRFVTIDVGDLAGAADPTAVICSLIGENLPLSGAVVRLRYQATEDVHRRVDHAQIQRVLDAASVHRVYGGIQWVKVGTTRARAQGVDETLDPLDAVGAWAAANDLAVDDAVRLSTLTKHYLEAA